MTKDEARMQVWDIVNHPKHPEHYQFKLDGRAIVCFANDSIGGARFDPHRITVDFWAGDTQTIAVHEALRKCVELGWRVKDWPLPLDP